MHPAHATVKQSAIEEPIPPRVQLIRPSLLKVCGVLDEQDAGSIQIDIATAGTCIPKRELVQSLRVDVAGRVVTRQTSGRRASAGEQGTPTTCASRGIVASLSR